MPLHGTRSHQLQCQSVHDRASVLPGCNSSCFVLFFFLAVREAKNLFALRKQTFNQLASKFDPKDESADDIIEYLKVLLLKSDGDYYMAVASLAALRSKDPRTPVSITSSSVVI